MNNSFRMDLMYESAKERLEELRGIDEWMEKTVKKAPEGKIRIVKRANSVMHYLREKPGEKNGKYLPKSNEKTIQTFLQKSYYEKAGKIIREEVERLQTFVDSYHDKQTLLDVYDSFPEASRAMIVQLEVSDLDYTRKWMAEKNRGLGFPDNYPIFMSDRGERVRSKSELNIANALYKHNIPYKYERPICLNNGHTVFPDFTCLDPHTRKEVVWEHLGMMDDRGYAKDNVGKLDEYILSDYYFGQDLIITAEVYNNPLETPVIEKMIEHYFPKQNRLSVHISQIDQQMADEEKSVSNYVRLPKLLESVTVRGKTCVV